MSFQPVRDHLAPNDLYALVAHWAPAALVPQPANIGLLLVDATAAALPRRPAVGTPWHAVAQRLAARMLAALAVSPNVVLCFDSPPPLRPGASAEPLYGVDVDGACVPDNFDACTFAAHGPSLAALYRRLAVALAARAVLAPGGVLRLDGLTTGAPIGVRDNVGPERHVYFDSVPPMVAASATRRICRWRALAAEPCLVAAPSQYTLMCLLHAENVCATPSRTTLITRALGTQAVDVRAALDGLSRVYMVSCAPLVDNSRLWTAVLAEVLAMANLHAMRHTCLAAALALLIAMPLHFAGLCEVSASGRVTLRPEPLQRAIAQLAYGSPPGAGRAEWLARVSQSCEQYMASLPQ